MSKNETTPRASIEKLDGKYFAEYETQDGRTFLNTEIDQNDFNDFAEVDIDDWCIVRADRDDEDLRADYADWFDSVDNLREEYAKSLPAYHLFLQMVEAIAEHKKQTN